ncbi:MAG: RsmB/NOP family class I SAM-dependent RNA methyltransferase [Treponemataceae bacterium]|nr:RsmB/NOP family class I SAM-dependent RNA methyltransferase [Treponemataceae bacterium]
MKKNKVSGEILFEQYYSEKFSDRWQQLKEAFDCEPSYCSISSPVSGEQYFMDSASVLCAGCLPVKEAGSILDMCAAPGGKSLILARRMSASANLHANERSKDRYCRLSKVLKSFLTEDVSERITCSCADGSLLCKNMNNRNRYDSILLDAPCSSERHVFNDKKYLDQWTANRIKSLSMSQWALMSSAFLMVKNGGYILYSTCALAEEENDGIIHRLVKKYENASVLSIDIDDRKSELVELIPGLSSSSLPDAERTEYGYRVLPDISDGAGPIYFCLIKKI